MRRLCVFCGSSEGRDPAYLQAARALGETLAVHGIGLVYGGASVGLMGALADAALGAGGDVTGVMPRALVEKEIAHNRLGDLRVVGSMHERKALMAELSDGFVALPGGIGTFEELFENVDVGTTRASHEALCPPERAGLLRRSDRVPRSGGRAWFIKGVHRAMLIVAQEPMELIERLRAYEPPAVSKWITAGER
jgi:uncharacterized protein (TIGR00730 family)